MWKLKKKGQEAVEGGLGGFGHIIFAMICVTVLVLGSLYIFGRFTEDKNAILTEVVQTLERAGVDGRASTTITLPASTYLAFFSDGKTRPNLPVCGKGCVCLCEDENLRKNVHQLTIAEASVCSSLRCLSMKSTAFQGVCSIDNALTRVTCDDPSGVILAPTTERETFSFFASQTKNGVKICSTYDCIACASETCGGCSFNECNIVPGRGFISGNCKSCSTIPVEKLHGLCEGQQRIDCFKEKPCGVACYYDLKCITCENSVCRTFTNVVDKSLCENNPCGLKCTRLPRGLCETSSVNLKEQASQ